MTILHLARLYSPHLGGVETHVAAISQELLAQGHQVMVITTQDESTQPESEVIKGVEVFRMPASATSKLDTWRWIWEHRALFAQADVVQIHDVFWWIWPIYLLIRNKVFMTFHGWEGAFPVSGTAKLQRWLANVLSRGSLHVGAWIQEFYWDKPDDVIYGGVSHVAAKVVIPTALEQIVFLGRLTAENEINSYLKVFKTLRETLPNLKVTWVGDGPAAAAASKVGQVTGMTSDLNRYLVNADLVFTNSYLSLLEVQATGKVAVSMYGQALKQRYLETYPGAEYLILGNQPQTVAAQILQLFEDRQQLKQHITEAHQWAKGMTWAKIAKVYEKIWTTKLAS